MYHADVIGYFGDVSEKRWVKPAEMPSRLCVCTLLCECIRGAGYVRGGWVCVCGGYMCVREVMCVYENWVCVRGAMFVYVGLCVCTCKIHSIRITHSISTIYIKQNT